MSLTTTPNLTDHDGFYEGLLAAHRDLTPDQSAALNAQLIMILANHIGDRAALSEAIALAKS